MNDSDAKRLKEIEARFKNSNKAFVTDEEFLASLVRKQAEEIENNEMLESPEQVKVNIDAALKFAQEKEILESRLKRYEKVVEAARISGDQLMDYAAWETDPQIGIAFKKFKQALADLGNWEEKVYDKPCYCREVKGSEPGHIHSSQPVQKGK